MTDNSSSEDIVILSADEALVYDLLRADPDTMDDMLKIRSDEKWQQKNMNDGSKIVPSELCLAEDSGLICTRPKGHDDDHIACAGFIGNVVHDWPNDVTEHVTTEQDKGEK